MTVQQHPLALLAKDDGLWLHLQGPDGNQALINLSALDHGAIVNAVLAETHRRLYTQVAGAARWRDAEEGAAMTEDAAAARSREPLLAYVQHKWDCRALLQPEYEKPCSCGLAELLAEAAPNENYR